jgi:RNA polymerase sigma factor (sigma-70 family)
MQGDADLGSRCAATVAALDAEFGWGLSESHRRDYCIALVDILPKNCSDMQLRNVVMCYHLDHRLVEALADRLHGQHDQHWQAWMGQVVAILRRAGLSWSDDAATSLEDLAQIARAQLAQAIPAYRYQSRFSTWAHQVIVQSVRRYLRDSRAQKRAGRPGSLDQPPASDVTIGDTEHPETIANARVLAAQVDSLLSLQPDKRLAEIFRLWAEADLRVEEIGRRMHLSSSQVRLLLSRIRDLLQHDPSIRAWRDQEKEGTPEDPSEHA